MNAGKKINLLIIGAQKCGTTSLHRYLSKHKNIYMSSPEKEPRYFLPIEKSKMYFFNQKGIQINSKDQLMSDLMYQGYHGEVYFGESSTDYTIGTNSSEFNLPYKIKQYNKNMKFIYILRNPFDRLISTYKHQKREGRVTCSFNDFISSLDDKHIYTSMYFYQLTKFIKYFERSHFCVLRFEDFFMNPESTIAEIYSFLEVDPAGGIKYFKSFNRSNDREKHLFSEENYSKLAGYFLSDSNQLQSEFFSSKSNEWDLGKEQWVK